MNLSPIMVFAEKILDAITDYRVQHQSEVPGEIRISLGDIQQMYHEQYYNSDSKWRGKYKMFKDGDTGALWGRPIRVEAKLPAGHAWVADREVMAEEDK